MCKNRLILYDFWYKTDMFEMMIDTGSDIYILIIRWFMIIKSWLAIGNLKSFQLCHFIYACFPGWKFGSETDYLAIILLVYWLINK